MFPKLSSIKHTIHVLALFFIIFIIEVSNGAIKLPFKLWFIPQKDDFEEFDPIDIYGPYIVCTIYALRCLILLALPYCIFVFCGLVFYNPYKVLPETISNQNKCPLICFRTVTRGDFPKLLRRNVLRNFATCQEAGLNNFCIEVVSDKPFELVFHPNIRLIDVPTNYASKTGTLYKARALQYCLEDGVSPMKDDEWIVHLDEETLVTPRSLCGIVKFVMSDKNHIGQGVITYGQEVVNWWTTLADSLRVADDYGKIRFAFKMFHRPVLGLKGSYLVTKVKAEKDVSFDNGLDGCVSEDCYFAMNACQKGYTFNFIEGEMWEKSPFTLMDMIRQRKRWFQGAYLVVHSKNIQKSVKFFFALTVYAGMTIPLTPLTVGLAIAYPLSTNDWLNFTSTFIFSLSIFMYMFGTIKTFQHRQMGVLRYIFLALCALFTLPFNFFLEITAVVWGLLSEKHVFFVVQKQTLSLDGDAVSKV